MKCTTRVEHDTEGKLESYRVNASLKRVLVSSSADKVVHTPQQNTDTNAYRDTRTISNFNLQTTIAS